jgi:hypothetical protein
MTLKGRVYMLYRHVREAELDQRTSGVRLLAETLVRGG